MATVIDELLVTLGLDATKFKTQAQQTTAEINLAVTSTIGMSKKLEDALKGHHTETTKRIKQVGEVGKSTAAEFSRLKNEVLALVGAMATAAGIQKFIKDVTTTENSLGRLSRAVGDMSVTTLDQFGQASARMGGDAKAAQQSILGLSEAIEDMRAHPNPELARVFASMGVMIGDPKTGAPLKTEDIIANTQKWFAAHAGKEAQFMGGQLHMDQGMIDLLSSPKFQEHWDAAGKHGLTKPEDVKAADDFIKALHDLDQSATNLGRTLFTDLEPQIGGILKDMDAWIQKHPELKDTIEKNIKEAITYIKDFLGAVKEVVAAVGGWQNATEIVLGIWVALKVEPIVSAIGRITAAMIALGVETKAVGLLFGPLGWIATAAAVLGGMVWDDERIKKHNLEHPEDPIKTWYDTMKGLWEGGKGFLGQHFGPPPELADTTMDDTQRSFLKTLSTPESGGAYNIKNGKSTFSDFSQFPEGIGPGGTSTASGRYQFTSDTWKALQKKYPGQFDDFSPATQDRGAWMKASDTYRENTGGDLYSDLKSGSHAADVAQALKGIWPSLPGGSQSRQDLRTFSEGLQENTGANSGGTPDPHYSPIMGKPGAFDPALSNLLRTPTAAAMTANDNSRSLNQTSEVHVGAVHVHVASGNPDSIARGVGASLRRYAFVATANAGLA